MAVYCISYDLKSNNYQALINAIKEYGVWWHQSESTWFIETFHSSKKIVDHLKNFLQNNDKIIVVKVANNWWSIGHTEDEYSWMKNRRF